MQEDEESFLTEEQELEIENEDADLHWLLSSERGRKLMWRALEETGLFQSVFDENHPAMSFREGKRNLGLKLLSTINRANSDLFLSMLEENGEFN
jgi:hypothetical protein